MSETEGGGGKIPLVRKTNPLTLHRDDSGIEPCQVGNPTSSDKVRIPTLSRTILELSRFLLCAEHTHTHTHINTKILGRL